MLRSTTRSRLRATVAVALAGGALSAGAVPQASPTQALMRPADIGKLPRPAADHELAYGDDPNQIGELRLPPGSGPFPVVVLIHGGCWLPQAPRYLAAMGEELKKDGIATWNIEYRRIGQAGGGWPGTYLDVGRAIDHLRTIAPRYHLDLDRTAVLGHSAGGHLAMWAATRRRLGRENAVYVADPINMAGTIDMSANIGHMEEKCRGPVVTSLMGGTVSAVSDRYRTVSAQTHLPLGVSQVLIWGDHEDFVPQPLVEQYVDAARRAGDRARLIVVPAAGHFETASPFTAAWAAVREAIKAALQE
jgi:acetyl esterase/lipase